MDVSVTISADPRAPKILKVRWDAKKMEKKNGYRGVQSKSSALNIPGPPFGILETGCAKVPISPEKANSSRRSRT